MIARIKSGALSLRSGREKMMDVSTAIHCAGCGSANYSLSSAAERQTPILCNDCGRQMGTVGGLMDELLAQVSAHSAEALRRDLDRIDDPPEPSQPA